MYFVSIRELFPMRSDGLGRALACTLYHDSRLVIVSSLWVASLLVLACCDAALINEGFTLELFRSEG
jgi:hypothetical protein